MLEHQSSLTGTTMKVLQYLTKAQGTAFTPEAICDIVHCSIPQAQAMLETLAGAGLVARQSSSTGSVSYLIPA
jgi:predicted transcriptional regulator